MNDKKSQRIGFLITHGTDTMSWGLSVLRYLIKNLPANIAITGSQIPISLRFAASDVYPNIENSIKLITQLTPSKIFVVFNNGRIAFQEAIWKIDKWDPEAFSGEKLALIAMDEIIIKGRSYPLNTERNLDILYLLRTGGTIESEENEVGILQPTANIVKDYIKNQLGNYFDQFKSISLMAKDSSDLVLDSWIAIGETIISKCHKYGYTTFLDKAFNNNVRIISTSPLKTEEEYKRLFKTTDGIILQGYGSGTINCDIDSGYSPLPAIREAITKGKVVIITSFTP
ncbi:MAG: asparaginase domain-containing protein, partial [Asgard group archaeon]|nr:asparaginase domain-containing protein [Asgard group archaeon]